MADLEIREATGGDVDGVRRVAERAWTAAYEDILAGDAIDRAMAEWYAADAVRAWTERDRWLFLVADSGGTVRGYVAGDLDATGGGRGEAAERAVGTLGAIYVEPDRWGEGIGSRLLDAFEAACRRSECDAIRLRVIAENDLGRSFYAGRGYAAVDARESTLFGEAVEELVLRRSLE